MSKITMEVHIVPVGTASTSLSSYVAGVIKTLEKEKNVKFQLTATGTILEGELDTLFGVAQRMHEAAFKSGIMRAVTTIRIDDRRDRESTIDSKMESVKKKLGKA